MKNYSIYLAGKFIKTETELLVKNPYDSSEIAVTYLANKAIVEQAIAKAVEVEDELKNMPIYKRYAILMQISNAIRNDKERLASVLSAESGKPMRYALGEIERAAQTFLVAAEESKRIPNEYLAIDWTPKGHGKEGIVKYFPIGLIAGISPFNFPLNLAVHKIAPAIATGNPIILKPARATPLSVLELAKIIDQTALPKAAVSILPMDRKSGNQLVTDTRIKKLSFTGSPEVGWYMKSQAGKKKVTLELGGNAGVIVSNKAAIDDAVKKCIVGSYAFSGQVCIHVQRIFVHTAIFDEFTKKMISATKALKIGNPNDIKTEVSAMIDEKNAIRVEEWVNDAKADGAKILCGGKRKGTFYEPTIITNTKPEMSVCRLEIFGPVVTIEKCETFKEGIEQINDSQYGLQAGVFTDSGSEINYAFNKLEVGGVIHNDIPTFRVDHMPYGGVKNSGFGREGVKYTMREMLEPKLLIKEI